MLHLKLQPLQNRAIHIVEKRYGYVNSAEMKELHTKLNLKMLRDRRKMFMLKLMFKFSQEDEI